MHQDWLYDEGEDATKAVYVAKMDELRALAGPIVQRHFEHVETQRQALQARLDAEAAAKKAAGGAAGADKAEAAEAARDEEMADADGTQTTVEEVEDER